MALFEAMNKLLHIKLLRLTKKSHTAMVVERFLIHNQTTLETKVSIIRSSIALIGDIVRVFTHNRGFTLY